LPDFNPLSANVVHARHDADEKTCNKMVYYTLYLR